MLDRILVSSNTKTVAESRSIRKHSTVFTISKSPVGVSLVVHTCVNFFYSTHLRRESVSSPELRWEDIFCSTVPALILGVGINTVHLRRGMYSSKSKRTSLNISGPVRERVVFFRFVCSCVDRYVVRVNQGYRIVKYSTI